MQCRKRVQSYRTKKIVPNKREDWIIVENTHQAIVSQELFDAVQKALDGRIRFVKRTGEPQIFSKLFYCAECGRSMLHHDRTNHPKYYSCGKYRADGAEACTSHHITYDNICEIVLKDIQKHVKLVEEDEGRAIQKILLICYNSYFYNEIYGRFVWNSKWTPKSIHLKIRNKNEKEWSPNFSVRLI